MLMIKSFAGSSQSYAFQNKLSTLTAELHQKKVKANEKIAKIITQEEKVFGVCVG